MELIYVINSVDESATRGGVEGRGRGPALKVSSWRTRLGPGAAEDRYPRGMGRRISGCGGLPADGADQCLRTRDGRVAARQRRAGRGPVELQVQLDLQRKQFNVPFGESNVTHLPQRRLWNVPRNPKSVVCEFQKSKPVRTPPTSDFALAEQPSADKKV